MTKPEAEAGDTEAAEEMMVAFELLQKYKKDREFLQKDVKQ